MDVFRRIFGKFQHLGTTISRTAPRGKSLNLRLQNFIFLLYVEDHLTTFFDSRLCCLWLFSSKILIFRENLLEICKSLRNEEATVRPWERQWSRVTHSETVRVERSDSFVWQKGTWINQKNRWEVLFSTYWKLFFTLLI